MVDQFVQLKARKEIEGYIADLHQQVIIGEKVGHLFYHLFTHGEDHTTVVKQYRQLEEQGLKNGTTLTDLAAGIIRIGNIVHRRDRSIAGKRDLILALRQY